MASLYGKMHCFSPIRQKSTNKHLKIQKSQPTISNLTIAIHQNVGHVGHVI